MLINLKVALFLAFKSAIRGNKAVVALMIFIMSLAFINLVFTSSILNGIIVTINNQVKTNLVSNIVIEPQEEPTKEDFIADADELQRQVKNIPGVTDAACHYKLTGSIAYDKEKNGKFKSVPASIIGVDPVQEEQFTEVTQKIVDGRYLEGLEDSDIVLGSELAGGYGGAGDDLRSLGGVRVGDKVEVIFSNGIKRDYKVKGIFKVNFGFVDRQAFIASKEAESVLSVHNSASQILVRTENDDEENQYISQIQSIDPNLKLRKWSEYMGELSGITESFNMITSVISAIGLVVAAVTIFILIYVNVVHRRRQIGILKAIGIKQNIIVYSYIFQALFYAISGIIIGALLVFYLIAPYFAAHPLKLPIGEASLALSNSLVMCSVFGLLLASLVAGLVPSWRGARENIIDAIWGS